MKLHFYVYIMVIRAVTGTRKKHENTGSNLDLRDLIQPATFLDPDIIIVVFNHDQFYMLKFIYRWIYVLKSIQFRFFTDFFGNHV